MAALPARPAPAPALAQEARATLRAFAAAAATALPGVVHGIVLFGSRARGTARPDSDWDVAVVVDDAAARDPQVAEALSDVAYEFILRGWWIDPIPLALDDLLPGAEARADFVGDAARRGVLP